MPAKKKLTLSVDAEIVEYAKQAGINISEITETVLRRFSFKGTTSDRTAAYEKYEKLFKTIAPLLQDFGVELHIGENTENQELHEGDPNTGEVTTRDDSFYLLRGNGSFYLETTRLFGDWTNPGQVSKTEFVKEERIFQIKQMKLEHIYPPNKILSNLVKAISGAKEKKEQIAELEVAIKIVEAMVSKRTTERDVELVKTVVSKRNTAKMDGEKAE